MSTFMQLFLLSGLGIIFSLAMRGFFRNKPIKTSEAVLMFVSGYCFLISGAVLIFTEVKF